MLILIISFDKLGSIKWYWVVINIVDIFGEIKIKWNINNYK